MNGMMLGAKIQTKKGLWTPQDVALSVNGIRDNAWGVKVSGTGLIDFGTWDPGITTNGTLEAWVYFFGAPGTSSMKLWGKRTGTTWSSTDPRWFVQMDTKGYFQMARYSPVLSFAYSPVLVAGWQHIAITITSTSTLKIHINGVLKDTQTGWSFGSATGGSLVVGNAPAGDGPSNCAFSELRMWDKARSAEEILADYKTRLVGDETNLIQYCPCDEGAGTTVNDLCSGNHDGTLGGSSCEWVRIPSLSLRAA